MIIKGKAIKTFAPAKKRNIRYSKTALNIRSNYFQFIKRFNL